MTQDKLNNDEFAELLYQVLTRNFKVDEFLKKINYPIVDDILSDESKMQDTVITAYIFYCWIIMLSVKKEFPEFYKEILDSFLKILCERGKMIMYKNIENFSLILNADFNKYDKALMDKKDPIFNLSKTFLNYIFKKEITDIRTIAFIGIFFGETSKAYNKIFSSVTLM